MLKSKPFVFILGMHRSGTSCLAGCLERSGLRLGDVRRSGRFNVKGYYENKEAERLHEQILKLNGSSWYCPPEKEVVIHPYHRQALKELSDKLANLRPAGVKDPRLLLLLAGWLELVAPPIQLVGTFRHPLAVAKSLSLRNGFAESKSVDLWLHYNNALIEYHKLKPFPLIAFDLSNVDHYCHSVETLARELGLTPHYSHLCHFVSQKLDHYPSETSVPRACEETYNYLKHHCLKTTINVVNSGREFLPFHKSLGTLREVLFLTGHAKKIFLDKHDFFYNKHQGRN